MSTLEPSELFDANTPTWRARVRFVRDLAPSGMGVFMAPQRSVGLRQSELLYGRTPLVLFSVLVAWIVAALALWPEVSTLGMIVWTLTLGASWGALALSWWRAQRPMLRPGAANSWTDMHVSYLWLVFLGLSSGIFLVFPDDSLTHQRALCMILICSGLIASILSSASIQALAAILGPTIGVVTGVLILRGATELGASVALAGGLIVLGGLGLYHISADRARREVETA